MKKILVAVLVGLVLAVLPICPIQFQIKTETLKSGRIIHPVYERKYPFNDWKMVFVNPLSREEATAWIQRQPHWFPLVAYDSIGGKFLPLDALPIPQS